MVWRSPKAARFRRAGRPRPTRSRPCSPPGGGGRSRSPGPPRAASRGCCRRGSPGGLTAQEIAAALGRHHTAVRAQLAEASSGPGWSRHGPTRPPAGPTAAALPAGGRSHRARGGGAPGADSPPHVAGPRGGLRPPPRSSASASARARASSSPAGASARSPPRSSGSGSRPGAPEMARRTTWCSAGVRSPTASRPRGERSSACFTEVSRGASRGGPPRCRGDRPRREGAEARGLPPSAVPARAAARRRWLGRRPRRRPGVTTSRRCWSTGPATGAAGSARLSAGPGGNGPTPSWGGGSARPAAASPGTGSGRGTSSFSCFRTPRSGSPSSSARRGSAPSARSRAPDCRPHASTTPPGDCGRRPW